MEFLKSILKSENRKKIKMPKKDQLIIFLLFGVLLLVIAIPAKPGKEKQGEKEVTQVAEGMAEGTKETLPADSYERQQEERLKGVLEKVEGVGRVDVMITLHASAQKVVEKDVAVTNEAVSESDSQGGARTTHNSTHGETTVYNDGSSQSQPYVSKELSPQIEGVVVIAEGGADSVVKQNITEAVQALFGIDTHKIRIMKKSSK